MGEGRRGGGDKPPKFSNRANRVREIKKKLADQMVPAGIEMGHFLNRDKMRKRARQREKKIRWSMGFLSSDLVKRLPSER